MHKARAAQSLPAVWALARNPEKACSALSGTPWKDGSRQAIPLTNRLERASQALRCPRNPSSRGGLDGEPLSVKTLGRLPAANRPAAGPPARR